MTAPKRVVLEQDTETEHVWQLIKTLFLLLSPVLENQRRLDHAQSGAALV